MKKTLFLVIFTLFCIGNIQALEVVEDWPEFPGGMEKLMPFIQENMRYPKSASKKCIEGRVICQFTVKKDGSIENIIIMRGVHKSLDKEAVRIIKKMPKWTPGKNYKRENIDSKYVIPFSFKLPK